LEPKMADTMLPKTLIFSSCVVAIRSHGAAGLFRASCAAHCGEVFDA
jgi:hypothetical protein